MATGLRPGLTVLGTAGAADDVPGDCDVQTRDQLDLDVPEAEYRVQVAKLDAYGRKIMDSFVTRAEQIHNGGVDAQWIIS